MASPVRERPAGTPLGAPGNFVRAPRRREVGGDAFPPALGLAAAGRVWSSTVASAASFLIARIPAMADAFASYASDVAITWPLGEVSTKRNFPVPTFLITNFPGTFRPPFRPGDRPTQPPARHRVDGPPALNAAPSLLEYWEHTNEPACLITRQTNYAGYQRPGEPLISSG